MVMKMGARMLDGLVGNIAIPKLSAGATAYWVDPDSTTGPTESKQTFGQVALSPKTVGGMTDISRQLLQQSSPSVDMLIEDDLQKILAIAIDAAALRLARVNNPADRRCCYIRHWLGCWWHCWRSAWAGLMLSSCGGVAVSTPSAAWAT